MSVGLLARVGVPAAVGVGAGIGAHVALQRETDSSKAAAAGVVAGTAVAAAGLLVRGSAGISLAAAGVGLLAGAGIGKVITSRSQGADASLPAFPDAAPVPPTPASPSPVPPPPAVTHAPLRTAVIGASTINRFVAVPARKNDYVPQPADLLPDGEQLAPQEVYVAGDATTGQRLLRFDSQVGNVGKGALQLADLEPHGSPPGGLHQVVFDSSGGSRLVPMKGELAHNSHPDHGHLHFDDFEKYELFELGSDGRIGRKVGANEKASFLIMDVKDLTPTVHEQEGRPNYDVLGGRTGRQQGLSVNWADVYPPGLDGQSIDVTGLAPGRYVLRQTFDPSNRLAEVDERNNVRDTIVDLR